MRHFNKKLVFAAAATALTAVIGVASAQTDETQQTDPMATPQQVDVNGQSGEHIMFMRDQGNSPETDPSAHLLLIKDKPMRPMPVAESTTTTTTTVAQTTTPADPAPAVVVNDTSANNMTDTTAAPVLAPKADRN